MAEMSKEFFIWLPRNENANYKIEIDGTDEFENVIEGRFSGAIIGEESGFEVLLDNNNDRFNSKYAGNETVDFYLEFTTGSPTKRLTFKIEKIRKETNNFGKVVRLVGTHRFHSVLLDITVTEEYQGATGDAILKDLITKYLTGYTSTNVAEITATPSLKWENVPLYDAIVDLCNACACDCYIDLDQDFHFFTRGTVLQDDEAVVWGDNRIEIKGLLTDILDVKNKVQISSEDDEGIPILYTSNNSASQSTHGVKEEVIKETDVADIDQAKELADSKVTAEPEERGGTRSSFLPGLLPGDYMWISEPGQGIHNRFRIVQFNHRIPDQETDCIVAKSKNVPTFLKERKRAEKGLSKLQNPEKMEYSFNDRFDNEDNIASKDSNVQVVDGALSLSTGNKGSVTSVTHTTPTGISATSIQFLAKGEALTGTKWEVSTNGGSTYKTVSLDTLTEVAAGTKIKYRVTLNSASTVVKSLGILYK